MCCRRQALAVSLQGPRRASLRRPVRNAARMPGGLIEEQGDKAMAEDQIVDLWDEEDEFDPLAVDDLDINQEDMDDDNPLDTVDYPPMRNMPEGMLRMVG